MTFVYYSSYNNNYESTVSRQMYDTIDDDLMYHKIGQEIKLMHICEFYVYMPLYKV